MQAPSHPASGPSLFFCGLSAVLLYGISGGIRSDIGILLEPLREATGLSYGGLSFAIAVLQLSFGLSQPFWGLLAARRSHRFVLLSGVGLFLLGLLGLSLFRSLWGLVLTLGLCLGCGAGAISFGLLLETVIFAVGPQKGALISGFINAAAGLGSTFFSPLLSRLSLVGGIPTVSVVLSLIMIGTLPFLFYLTQPLKRMVLQEKGPVPEASFGLLLQGALKRPEFRYLLGAFTTCGFHMALIEAHLFSQLLSYGLQRPRAAHAFAAYGLSTVIGALISGYLSGPCFQKPSSDHLLWLPCGFDSHISLFPAKNFPVGPFLLHRSRHVRRGHSYADVRNRHGAFSSCPIGSTCGTPFFRASARRLSQCIFGRHDRGCNRKLSRHLGNRYRVLSSGVLSKCQDFASSTREIDWIQL